MRAASHIKALSQLFDVTLAIVGQIGSEVDIQERLAGDVRAACVSVVVINRVSVITRLLRRTRNSWARLLLEVLWPTPAEFASCRLALAELGKYFAGESFDVVHCFRLYTGSWHLLKRHSIKIGRAVLDLDDYESKAAFRSSAAFRNLLGTKLSVVNWITAVKWRVLESLLIPSFDDALACSDLDRQTLRFRFPGTDWHTVPNIASQPSKIDAIEKGWFTFLFVGQLGYIPNWDAVLFFCTQVIPILRRNAPGKFRVLIVGPPGGDLDRLAGIEEVQILVNPPDLAPYYARSDVVIVPLRGGGGTRIKVLEAFSYGLPVISTTVGAEGLDVTPEADIMIADTAEAFAEECLRIWTDQRLRRRIAAAGHDLWQRRYNPAALVTVLNTIYCKQTILMAAPAVPQAEITRAIPAKLDRDD